MLRILQISNKAPYPANDGSSIAIYNLAKGLVHAGAELHLLTINTKKHFKPDNEVPQEFREQTHYQSVYADTDVTLLGALINLGSKQSYFVDRFYFEDFEKAIITKLKNYQFDIIQLEGLFVATYIPTIRKHSNAKIVLRTHNIEHKIWERYIKTETNPLKKIYLSLQNKRLRQFELAVFNQIDAIVPITSVDKTVIESYTHSKQILASPTGINLSDYNLVTEPVYENTLFYFASMDWIPNIEAVDWFLANCWQQIYIANQSVKLVIAGRGMPEKFKQLKSDRIEVIENVPNSKEFYEHYDVMIVPILSGSGLRIKIVEGLAYGKPIVTTTIGAEGIKFKNGEHMLVADTANEFVIAVNQLLRNQQLKHELGHNARQLAVEQFDNCLLANQLVHFYKQLS